MRNLLPVVGHDRRLADAKRMHLFQAFRGQTGGIVAL